jgi:hypothetical protein
MKQKRLSTFAWLLIGMFAALLVASRVVLHLPLKLPGNSGVMWMAILLTVSAVVPRPGAATATGGLAGVMAVFVGLGDHGALVTVLSYLAAGAGVDALRLLTARRESMPIFALAGLTGHLAKLGVKVGLEILAGIPVGFVLFGRAYALVSYAIFGTIGGALGFVLVRALRRAGYFAYLEGRH